MSFEYRHIILNSIINTLLNEQDNKAGLSFNKLYEKSKEFLKRSDLDYTPSKTDFWYHIKKMLEDNELNKTQDKTSSLKIKPEYYSLTDVAKKRLHLNLLGVGDEQTRFRKIYEKLFFWEYFHTRPMPIPSEQRLEEMLNHIKQGLPVSQVLSTLGWGQVTDSSNGFLRDEVGSLRYQRYWNEKEEEGLLMIVQHVDSLYHVTTSPKIFFTKREYWEATKYSKKLLFAKYTLNLPGVSKEEFLTYHNKFSEVKFTDEEVGRAFLLLKESGLIKPHIVLENEVRYIMTDNELQELIKNISRFLEHELILLIFKWRYFEKPTEEEKKRLTWILGKEYSKRVIQRAEIIMYQNKQAIKKCKCINEYCDYLREDLKGFPTWAVESQIYEDISRFMYKYEDRKVEDVARDVNGFHEFRRERHRYLESDLSDWIKDTKMQYEKTIQEYAYLFHYVLAMVCPLLLKLPAESYYTVEDIKARELAAYEIEKELNPPGFHDSMRRHTDEYGITHMDEVLNDMKKINRKKRPGITSRKSKGKSNSVRQMKKE